MRDDGNRAKMMIRLVAAFLSLLLMLTDTGLAGPLSRVAPVGHAIGSQDASHMGASILLVQNRGMYRAPSYQQNYNYQRLLQQQQQQQRLQQQQMQRQRMEQQRQQQALQRQRMQEQQRLQQQAMRQRQLQMQAQRQRMTEQRRLTQTRQREEIQRRQAEQSQAARNLATETQRLANAQRLRIDQQSRIRQFRLQRETREKLERQQQKATVPLAAGLAATGGPTAAGSQDLSARLENARKSLTAVAPAKATLKQDAARTGKTGPKHSQPADPLGSMSKEPPNWRPSLTEQFNKASALGKNYGKLGIVVDPPRRLSSIKLSDHYLDRKISRQVPSKHILSTIKNPDVVLKQDNNTYLYISKYAAVAIKTDGTIKTTYSMNQYDDSIINILEDSK